MNGYKLEKELCPLVASTATGIAEKNLLNSCHILFGPEIDVSNDFLAYIKPEGIKSAYRKRVFETHPDINSCETVLGRQQQTDLFISVQQAYETLNDYLQTREKDRRSTDAGWKAARRKSTTYPSRPQPVHNDHSRPKRRARPGQTRNGCGPGKVDQGGPDLRKIYKGPMPARKLLLGHYLYYSGVISWRHMIQALVWQRSQRPRLGEICLRLGWMQKEDILLVLQKRSYVAPFGKTAIDLGLINERQLTMIISYQRRLQKKIGSFFVEHDILSARELNEILVKFYQHNAKSTGRRRDISTKATSCSKADRTPARLQTS